MPAGGQGPVNLDVGAAFSYAFSAFGRNALPFLGLGALIVVVSFGTSFAGALIDGTFAAVSSGTGNDTASGFAYNTSPASTFLSIAALIVNLVLSVGLVRMAFDVLDGRKAELGRAFTGFNVGRAAGVAFVGGLIAGIGLLLCILPGIALWFFLLFAVPLVVDRGVSFGDAFGDSFSLVKDNLGSMVLIALILAGFAIVSACTCGLAGLVLSPVGAIITAYAFRVVTRGQISALA